MHVILASFQLTWKDSFYFVYKILFCFPALNSNQMC